MLPLVCVGSNVSRPARVRYLCLWLAKATSNRDVRGALLINP